MRKSTILLFALAAFWSAALPAHADHNNNNYIKGLWTNGGSESYCLSDFADDLTAGEYTNMISSTINRINQVELDVSDLNTNFSMTAGIECTNNYNFYAYNCDTIREQLPGIASRIDYQQTEGSDRGETRRCDLNVDNRYDFFWIIIDKEEPYFNIHWDVFSIPSQGHWDYPGLLVHEFVHALGFQGHFPGTSAACTVSVGLYNDMCDNSDLGFNHTGSSNGTWWRTLEAHDIGELNQAYPSGY